MCIQEKSFTMRVLLLLSWWFVLCEQEYSVLRIFELKGRF